MAAAASNASAWAASRPSTSTIFSREAAPATIRTSRRGTPSTLDSNRWSEPFARPSAGGAAIRTFQPSAWRPTIAERFAPGETRRVSLVDESVTEGF